MSDFYENKSNLTDNAPSSSGSDNSQSGNSGNGKRHNKKRYNNHRRPNNHPNGQNNQKHQNATDVQDQPKAFATEPASDAPALINNKENESGKSKSHHKQNHNRRGGKNKGNRYTQGSQGAEQRDTKKVKTPADESAVSEAPAQANLKNDHPGDLSQKSGRARGKQKDNKKSDEPSSAISEIADYSAPPSYSAAPILFSDLDSSLIKANDSYLDSIPPDPTLDEVFSGESAPASEPIDGPEIVGIRFEHGSKVYYFAPGEFRLSVGDHAIVDTAQGIEYGQVVIANRNVPEESVVSPLRSVIRPATQDDIEHHQANKRREKEAFKICLEKIAKHGLEMKLVETQYTFDNTKLIFFFTAAGRVDFRELVRDLASVFRTRIELRQIGIRDEAKMIGGFGVCGRKLCCSGFLPNFAQVSIKMAKEQGLSLNSAKISGTCGRLMCCLRFEQDTYEREIALMPTPDSVVDTADGRGIVTDIFPISGSVRVKLHDKPDIAPKIYRLADIRVITRAARRQDDDSES